MNGTLKHVAFALFYSGAGVIIGAAALYGYQLGQGPPIEAWHQTTLDEEFSVDRDNAGLDFHEYLKLEDRLFAQLEQQVVQKVPKTLEHRLNRYSAGSLADPGNQKINWNRSFEMFAKPAVGGVLMLHELSGSPYSMRSLGRFLNFRGFRVVALRLPGHGTTPAGLARASWKDFAAATRIAARHLHGQLQEHQPFYILGFSVGAALAIEYSLAVIEGEGLPAAKGLILISPLIATAKHSERARWQAKLLGIPVLEKLGWAAILPEFDPYKYNSFAIATGAQIDDLTTSIADRIHRLSARGALKSFPQVIAFQSAADCTVPAGSVVENLFRYLEPRKHELVLFDLNRFAEAGKLLDPKAAAAARQYLMTPALPFDLTVVTNRNSKTRDITALRKPALSDRVIARPLERRWPVGITSLSHLSLPIPPTDPVYGEISNEDRKQVFLGDVEVRGERGVLSIPAGLLLRLRSNPFYEYLAERILDAVARSDRSATLPTATAPELP